MAPLPLKLKRDEFSQNFDKITRNFQCDETVTGILMLRRVLLIPVADSGGP
jgi:hypothetical protein